MASKKSWFVYIVKCSNGAFYTGITTDVERRVSEHNSGQGASYTRSFGPVKLLWTEIHKSRSSAQKREAAIKKLSASEKAELIKKCKR
jgi:putative endonuclease